MGGLAHRARWSPSYFHGCGWLGARVGGRGFEWHTQNWDMRGWRSLPPASSEQMSADVEPPYVDRDPMNV